MWIILCLFINLPYAVLTFFESRVTIELLDDGGTPHFANWSRLKFPDIEKLFRVKGDRVKSLSIRHTSINGIDAKILKDLINLSKLEIINNRNLKRLETNTFKWNKDLSYLSLDGNSIRTISPGAFNGLFKSSKLRAALHLSGNNIYNLPLLEETFPGLLSLTLDDNPLQYFNTRQFKPMPSLGRLWARRTSIRSIEKNVFSGMASLHFLALTDNKELSNVDGDAFDGTNLQNLDLSGTDISMLPSKGLENLITLKVGNTPNLFEISDYIAAIGTLKTVKVSDGQRYLCCAFEMKRAQLKTIYKKKQVADREKLCPIQNAIVTTPVSPLKRKRERRFPRDVASDDAFGGFGLHGDGDKKNTNAGRLVLATGTPKTNKPITDDFFPLGKGDGPQPVSGLASHSNGNVICANQSSGEIHTDEFVDVTCTPRPDALRPCDDIMGDYLLTALSCLVAIVGLFANAFVFSVISLSKRAFTVTKFLLQNLSFADLCLALYLFLLVCASGHTSGTYYNYVKRWQYGGGCAVAGFLAVFSSQLSMLVLVAITVERYFAIVYAMRFNLRLSFKKAKIGMIASWCIAFIMAILPILGVNSYTGVAICLPFRTSSKLDLVYIGVLLVFNVFLFLFVLFSYLRMYWVVRSPHLDCGGERSDSEVAKRMALLVFTDFFCWAPIAFVAFISAFGGHDLIDMDVKKAKYLLVIFFPINSLCNPFLYATTTNTFKRDVYDIILRCGFCQAHVAKVNESLYSKSGNRNPLRSSVDTGSTMQYTQRNSAVKLIRKSPLIGRHLDQMMLNRSLSDTPLLNGLNKGSHNLKDVARKLRVNRDKQRQINQRFCTNRGSAQALSIPLKEFTKNINSKSDANCPTLTVSETTKMPLVRVRSNSDGLISNGSISPAYKQIRFSYYDLTPDSFRKAKETTCL